MSESVDLKILHEVLVNLVTVPEDVKVERSLDEQGVLLSVRVNSKDMGIVIGRSGSMATAIKTVMRAIGKANQMNIRIEFQEPDGSIRYGDKSNQESETAPSSSGSIIEEDLSEFVIS